MNDSESDDNEYFLESGPTLFNYQDTLSHGSIIKAAYAEDLDLLKDLVRKGYAVNANDNRGYTALHIAVLKKNVDMVKYLIEETDCIIDNVDHKNETALFKSLEPHFDSTIAANLIEAGADVNKATLSMLTPLHKAVMHSSYMTQLLIENGADINAVEGVNSYTPLHVAVEEGRYEEFCTLLYYGADTSICNDYNTTPFMLAVSLDVDLEIQKLLLNYEADVNLKDYEGYSSLLLAMNYRNPLALDLIERGADIYYEKGIANVVNFLFAYEDNVIFEQIWSLIEPHFFNKAEVELSNLFDVAISNDDWRKRINLILTSNKAEILILEYNKEILNYLILTCHHHRMREDELFPLVSICLMYGAEVSYTNALETFHFYGYCKTFKLLLHMGISVNSCNQDLVLPYFVCCVSPHLRGYENYCRWCCRVKLKEKEIKKLSKYMKFIFALCASCRRYYVGNNEKVPSLLELSRLATRRAISLRFNIRNTLMFYTIVNYLEVPTVIKQLIGYEKPII